jgi:phenylpropionate dioxygenase-like ring-hydroxylating dioxygenase large terminal subunit
VIVVRGTDHQLRAFTNVCRHRASPLVDGSSGCAKKLVCPYHAWTYEPTAADRRSRQRQLSGLDKAKAGLAGRTLEIWHGFIFVRLEDDGGPSVAEMMAPYEAKSRPTASTELRALRPRHAAAARRQLEECRRQLFGRAAHPHRASRPDPLFGKSYGIEAEPSMSTGCGAISRTRPSVNWSERAYHRLLPPVPHLPETSHRLWLYFKLWPNVAFDIYPDQVDFMQWLPTGRRPLLIREISYVLPDDRREMKAARYLNWRINRQVNAEDTALISRVQAGMASR